MGTTKVVIVRGSPRHAGNTAALADQLAEGAKAAGAEVVDFFLHGLDIAACDACDACKVEPYDGCIIGDDMQLLYAQLAEADAFVVASPVYYFTVSAQTKLFMDRCYGFHDGRNSRLFGKRVGILMAYEDEDPFVSGAVNALRTFQDAYAYVGAEIVGMVYGTALEAGEIRDNVKAMDSAFELGRKLASPR